MRGNCADPIPTPLIRCAICDKIVDRVEVIPRFGSPGVRFRVWCHESVDTCDVDELTLARASEQDLEAGVAFVAPRIETKEMEMRTEIYNPHDRPEESLPTIFAFCNGSEYGVLRGVLLAEDGSCLGGHLSSTEAWLMSDLGVIEGAAPDRHAEFRRHYPEGYRMEYVPYARVLSHSGLMAAYERNQRTKTPEDEE